MVVLALAYQGGLHLSETILYWTVALTVFPVHHRES